MKNKVFIISIVIWVCVTLFRMFNHIPWLDEAHAWTIAQELNLTEIIKLMKVEGHTLIWYLMLMPFAKLNFGYPYIMQMLNWIFCFGAIILLWKKSPFSDLMKVLITFSFPFFTVYPILARCYSIGIFLLFLLTILYKDKLKHPIIYSILLVLCANTSVMALFGATAFGILFLYDFFKEKCNLKNLIIPSIIFVLGGSLILYVLSGSDSTYLLEFRGLKPLVKNIAWWYFVPVLICTGVSLFCIKQSKKALFFVGFTYLALSYCFIFKYFGHYWNHYFYYIYLLIAVWVAIDLGLKLNKALIISLCIISILNINAYGNLSRIINREVFSYEIQNIFKVLTNDENIKNKTIILDDINYIGYALIPYSKNNKFNLKSYCYDVVYDVDTKVISENTEWCYFEDDKEDSFVQRNDSKRLASLFDKNAFFVSYFNQELYPEQLKQILKKYPKSVVNMATFENGKIKGNSIVWDNLKLTPYKCFAYEKTQVKCIWYVEKF